MMKFPRWLSWMFILALGYIVYNASQLSGPRPVTAPAKPIVPMITQEKYPALAEMTDMERWRKRIDPAYAAIMSCETDTNKAKDTLFMKTTELAEGNGEPAACGKPVTLQLTIWNSAGGKAFSQELVLNLGSRELAAGLDQGLVGIKPGGERLLVLPPYALTRARQTSLSPAVLKALPADTLAIVTVKRLK